MTDTKTAARIGELKTEIDLLRRELSALQGSKISPLAPQDGFPELPVIDGVRFASAAGGVRYKGRNDIMLAEVCGHSSIAGVFTTSATRSAPVLACQRNLASLAGSTASGPVGIIVNSGNANAFTGRHGDSSTTSIMEQTAKLLETDPDLIFPASTGVIGERLPEKLITQKLGELVAKLSPRLSEEVARAIMTTDTFPKAASAQIEVDGKSVSIAGFAKGSGMIAPDMATMLVYIFTDGKISQRHLQALVSEHCQTTFNAITVDSDTSTSDTLIVAATGRSADVETSSEFVTALTQVMKQLAQQVVRDGEGATKFVEVEVNGATTDASAQTVAKAIANSPLVKTAIAGEDPNWGRVVMAIGKSGQPADRDNISIRFGDILVAENGWLSPDYKESAAAEYMKDENLKICVELGVGSGSATVWTCDLTHDYISINADYRS